MFLLVGCPFALQCLLCFVAVKAMEEKREQKHVTKKLANFITSLAL